MHGISLKYDVVRHFKCSTTSTFFDDFIHTVSINDDLLIDQLKEDIDEIIFLGIQPDLVGFYMPMNEKVVAAVQQVYAALPNWHGLGGFTLFDGE